MWIDTRDRNPSKDGFYIFQDVTGDIGAANYTTEYGWNTSRNMDGTVHSKSKMNNYYVVRWYEVPRPEPIPEEWVSEWRANR